MKRLIRMALGAAAVTALSAAPSYANTFVTIVDNTSGQTATIVNAGQLISTTSVQVGNFLFTGLQVNTNVPGTPGSATASDNKLNVVYNGAAGGAPATGSVTVTFGGTGFTQPGTTPLKLSGSATQNVLESSGTTTEGFTACGNNADNQSATGFCTSLATALVTPAGDTTVASASTPDISFGSDGTFSLVGMETITMVLGATSSFSGQIRATPVPEPASLLLLGTGFAGLAARVRRQRRARA